MAGKLPESWELVAERDGMVRIIPGGSARRATGLLLVMLGLLCAAFVVPLFATLATGRASWRSLRLTLCLPLGIMLVIYGFWVALGREEWKVGPDLLEVRQTLFGLRRISRYRRARLKLVRSRGTSEPWWALFVQCSGAIRCLRSSARTNDRKEDPRALTEYLSEQTGWRIVSAEPAARRTAVRRR